MAIPIFDDNNGPSGEIIEGSGAKIRKELMNLPLVKKKRRRTVTQTPSIANLKKHTANRISLNKRLKQIKDKLR